MDVDDDVSTEQMAMKVRRIAARELDMLDAMPMLGEDGLDRLAKIALVLQRVRPAPAGQGAGSELTDEQVRKKASAA